MRLCGPWKDAGHVYVGHRYGSCQKTGNCTDTHCPHKFGDDDEWCCCCVQNVSLDRDLEGYKNAGYPDFEEDILPTPLDRATDDIGITIADDENTRAASRAIILVEGAAMLTAWLSEVESRQSRLDISESERV